MKTDNRNAKEQVDSDAVQIDNGDDSQINVLHYEEEITKSLQSLSKTKEPRIILAISLSSMLPFAGDYSSS